MSFWGPLVQTLLGGVGQMAGGWLEKKGEERQIPGLSGAGNWGQQLGQMGGAMLMGDALPGTGAEAGQYAKEYFDKIAPNSGPWDRLGANSPGAQLAAEHRKSDLAERMQKRDLKNKIDVAEIQRKTALETKGMDFGLEGVTAAASLGRGEMPAHRFNYQKAVALAKLVPELNNLKADEQARLASAAHSIAQAKLTGEETKLRAAVAEYADLIALQQGFGGAATSLVASGAGRLLDMLSPGLNNLVKHLLPKKVRKIMYPKTKPTRKFTQQSKYKKDGIEYTHKHETSGLKP